MPAFEQEPIGKTSLRQTPAVSLLNLEKHFYLDKKLFGRVSKSGSVLKAVDGVTLSIPKGKTYCLVGESGCGKSTLARMVAGLLSPTSGSIELDSSPSPDRSELNIQMIFQDPYSSLNPRWRIGDIVAEPLRTLKPNVAKGEVADRVANYLSIVGLAPADANKYPHEFSGGQRQRIAIARALIVLPQLLICDEPTSALDVSVQAQILNLMKDLQDRLGLSYLFISHNLAVVSYMADEVGVMYLGKLVESGPAKRVLRSPSHPYTRMLLDAILDIDRAGREHFMISGEVPNPLNPPNGCRFHPRCPLATSECQTVEPGLSFKQGRFVSCHAVREGSPLPTLS